MELSKVKSLAELDLLCPDESSCTCVLLEQGYLNNDPHCEKCGKAMKLRSRKNLKEWRCRKNKIQDCSVVSVKKGSFFAKACIPMKTTVKLVIMWINRYTGYQMERELKLSNKTVVDYKHFMRELCNKRVQSYGKIGGDGKVVQIDETCVHSRKYGRGEKERELTWILGGTEVGSRKSFAVIVKNRTAKEMIPILRKHIDRDSEVHSDLWKSYSSLKTVFKKHRTVNHSIQYKKTDDDGTVVHTNNIESLWQRIKKPLKQANGTSEPLLPSYINEVIVREWEGDGFQDAMFDGIKDFLNI